jgi:dimethylaniline monooxygenase (N-oxide forming)
VSDQEEDAVRTVDVVVVGAGMGGLACARWLTAHGHEVVVLEGHSSLGGQWDASNPRSGVWPQMRTNTAYFLTRFSDTHYADGVRMFPRNGEVLGLLDRYADEFDLRRRIRFGAEVVRVTRHGDGYEVVWAEDGEQRSLHVARVVVASGRYNRPEVPPVPGLDAFTGVGGVRHAFTYAGPEEHRGRRVLVCGGSISALEVASDLALGGAAEVHLAQRRQRYVMPKMVAGTPIESYVFTREGALALESSSSAELLAATAERILSLGGDPTRYGAPAPHPDIAQAGVTGSPHYLNLVAEDRISVHPWVRAVDGDTVEFTDGSQVEVDTIVPATGFDLHLPFLDPELASAVRLTRTSLDLADFTFHPDLDGLAFVGLWAQLGPYAVPLEQQARWIAYTWSGVVPAPTHDELCASLTRCVEQRLGVGYREQHEMAVRFGRLAGVDPGGAAAEELAAEDPELAAVLPLATVTADTFRLVGPDRDPGARERVLATFWAHSPPAVVAAVREALAAARAPR